MVNEIEEEEETEELLSRDPTDWKDQDHYEVLGLSKLRYKATSAQVKAAYHKKVLKHHPDKKASLGNVHDDTFFKCIQKAYEILSDPIRRRQYDSVDPKFNDTIPVFKPGADFSETFGPVFEREGRFSKNPQVPPIGDLSSDRETVENFYNFWHNFDSWRSFEYLDKEEKGEAENREDKRYTEKKNKADRARRKKEDSARLRKIIDFAIASDPRIKRFKEEEKTAKENKQKEKREAGEMAAERARLEEERVRADRMKKEEEQKLVEAAKKKEREAKKKLLRNERRSIKTLVKDANHFLPSSETPSPATIEQQLSELDVLLEQLTLAQTEIFRRDLEADRTKEKVVAEVKKIIEAGLTNVEAFDAFRPKDISVSSITDRSKPVATSQQPTSQIQDKQNPWTVEETSMLIKAAKKFPTGTVNRLGTIANWVATHCGLPKRSEEEIVQRINEMKKGATSLAQNEKNRLQFARRHNDTRIDDGPTIRYDTPSAAAAGPASQTTPQPSTEDSVKKDPKEERPWTPAEQTQLETALKAYPPSWKGEGDRWEKIAEGVSNRSKKECKARVKSLSEQIRAKKG